MGTNPTNPDTDGDGVPDNSDKAMGDMMLEIDINHFLLNGDSCNGVFFVIKVNGTNIATERVSVSGSAEQWPYLKYYVEVPDDLNNITINLQAWEDSPTCNWFREDKQLNIQGTSNCVSPTYYFDTGAENLHYVGTGSGSITVDMTLNTFEPQKTRTTVIEGVGGTTDYGLEQNDDGTYHYDADQQLYVIYVNCTGAGDAHFAPGLNTILLPRAVALQGQLNYTFADLTGRLSGTVLGGATLYDTNTGAATSSGSVIMVISVSLNTSNAEKLLTMLTFSHPNKRIGDNVTVS